MTTTTAPHRPSASDLASATPAGRDRYVDFLRIASIAVVVAGHWLMSVVTWHDGELETGNVLGMVPWLWLATWVLQVMPIFFFVGGFANLVTLDAMHRKGQGTPQFLAGRVQRLLRPVITLFAVWIPLSAVILAAGVDGDAFGKATRVVCQPLWFVGAYLMVTAFAPVMRQLHMRFGTNVLAGLTIATITVDIFRFNVAGGIGYFNLLFVWLFAQQLGFFYADGSLLRMSRTRLAAMAGGALSALVALTTFGPYPNSMVGLPGAKVSNMTPPTTCLLVLTVFQAALVMLARPALSRWLERRRVWTAVVAGNGVIMTIFLWHLTALLVTIGALYPIGFPQPEGGTAMWWATRPLLFGAALVPLTIFVALLGRFERPKPTSYDCVAHATLPAAIAVAATALGIYGMAASNLADVFTGHPANVVVLQLTFLQSVGLGFAGWLLLRTTVRPQQSRLSSKGIAR
jgi:hypothetical protein